MSKDARDRCLARYAEMHALWRASGDRARGISRDEAKRLRDAARVAYFEALPRVPLGRCCWCNSALTGQLDPWGFDGFWWQEREMGLQTEPSGCRHFRVLTGAVALGEPEPVGGRYEAHLGPGVPFVIPAVLELPTMVAVISSVTMEMGATAFPIAYFSAEPPPEGSLCASWRATSYSFRTPDGKAAWTIKNDPWDFDLEPWIRRDKLRWIAPGSQELAASDAACPYLDRRGQRRPQIVKGKRLYLGLLP